MSVDGSGEILTALEVAKLLKISRAMIYRLRAEGRLPARFKLFEGERGWRWTKTDVDAFLRSTMIPELEPIKRTERSIPRFEPVKIAKKSPTA